MIYAQASFTIHKDGTVSAKLLDESGIEIDAVYQTREEAERVEACAVHWGLGYPIYVKDLKNE